MKRALSKIFKQASDIKKTAGRINHTQTQGNSSAPISSWDMQDKPSPTATKLAKPSIRPLLLTNPIFTNDSGCLPQ
jgi:hypothetical protein